MEYEFDIFVSYRRRGGIPTWVQSVLVPELKSHLDEYLDNEVRIAVDEDIIEAGDSWPGAAFGGAPPCANNL
jgi:hypothetical protein